MALGESFQFEIGADIRQAQERLDALKRRLGDLKGDVADVDGERINLEVDGREVEDVRDAVEDLRRTAERGIDLNVDANRSAARTADDVRRMQVNAEGLQSGIGPLRGFTDELGGAAGAGGIAASALIDAGEAAQIFGSQLGFSEAALGRMSLALGGIGLAAGGAIALFQYLRDRQAEIEEQTRETTNALLDQLGILDGIEGRFSQASTGYESLADRLIGDEGKRQAVLADLLRLQLTLEDLPDVVQAIATADAGFFSEILTGRGVSPAVADEVARLVAEGKSFHEVISDPDVNTAFWKMDEDARTAVRTVAELGGEMRGLRIDQAVTESLGVILAEGGAAADELRRLREQFPDASYIELYDMLARSIASIRENAANVPPPFDQSDLDAVLGIAGGMREVADNTAAAVTQTDTLLGKYDLLTGRINEERALFGITEQYQRTLEALARKTEAEAAGSADAAEAATDYRLQLLDLQRQVISYGESFDDIPAERITRLYTAIDQGDLTRVANLLGELTADRTIRISIDAAGAGPVKFLIDPAGGAPTQVSGARTPTVIAGAPSVPTPPPAFTLDDLERALSRTNSRVTNVYTIGVDPVQAQRDYEFGNGAR